MKKKIARLLAAVMTATMVPATAAFADSSNSINKVVTVKDGDFNDEVYLRIQPGEVVDMDDSIIITIENGEFDPDDIDGDISEVYGYDLAGNSYDDFKKEYQALIDDGRTPERAFDETFYEIMNTEKVVDLPYKIKRNTNIRSNIVRYS